MRCWTRNTPGLESKPYMERLRIFKLSSTERRSERYIILYCYKVIEKLIVNPGMEWKDSYKGRKFLIPKIPKNRNAISILEKSFFVQGPRIWNLLPEYVRNTTNLTTLSFKAILDQFLASVQDEPYCSMVTPAPTDLNTGLRSNSLCAWIPFIKKKSQLRVSVVKFHEVTLTLYSHHTHSSI